jgi:transposase
MIYFDCMGRPIAIIELTPDERSELARRVSSTTASVRDHLRAAVILQCSEGKRQVDIAKEMHTTVSKINRWSRRFADNGLAGLNDSPGRGRKTSIPEKTVNRVLTEVTRPPSPRTRWSVRTMARHAGISPDSVHRIWRANDLKPHITKTFKLSNDPEFEKKFWDVIGLYLDPPQKALVLCCDEKSQCQALDRTQPSLPLGVGGYRKTRTHDYVRHGTVTLFAALNYLDGKLISRTEKNHTHVQWLRFLKQINRETPRSLDIHLIMDNYGTHKHENVRRWLVRHPRIKVHFTPTSSSWLNLVERFFRDLTEDVVREGSFTSVNELVRDIVEYMAQRNLEPQPYRWKADGEIILRKISRARQKLDSVNNHV